MAPSPPHVIQELPPEWPIALDTDTEVWHNSPRDQRAHKEGIRAPSDNTSTERGALSRVETGATVSEKENSLVVVGSTTIFDEAGKIRLIPTPTPDPTDPLNLPNWRKYAAIGSLCLFGSISLCADMVVTGLLPVFLLEYSGVDPRPILKHADMKGNPSPLALVPPGVHAISLYQVTLLSTLPSVCNCIASYFLVPLSLAVGRRPVLLVTAMLSWIGGFLAGFSKSLRQHLIARVVHGLGSATVEALLPLVMQDMVFIHQRNRAIAAIIACQGPLLTVFGIIGPYISVNYSWRWLYFISSGICILAWFLLIGFVPESRKIRSKQELNGQQLWPVAPGESRTQLDFETYKKRTLWDNLGVFNRGFEWKEASIQILRTLQTTYFPAVLLVILVDAVFFVIMQSMGQTIPFAMMAAGVPYELSGLYIITGVFSSAIIYLFGGPFADKLTLKISRMRGKVDREPEYQLPNLVVPFLSAMAGCAIFGCAQHFKLHVAVLLVGGFFLMIGSMTVATILKTFIIESYPQWPGPVLVNVSTWRTLISFFFSSHASSWVQERGALFVFGMYLVVLFVMFGLIPLFYFFGKSFRTWTAGRIKVDNDEGSSATPHANGPTSDVMGSPRPEVPTTNGSNSKTDITSSDEMSDLHQTTTTGSIEKFLGQTGTVEIQESGRGKQTGTTTTKEVE